MQVVKLDVITNLWDLADVKFTVLLVVITRDLHPTFELQREWLTVTVF